MGSAGARVPDEAPDLYGLDPDQFVAARDELVKRLRAEGDRTSAAEVAKLRRPPAVAWALNQVARREPDLVTAVLDRGAALRAAMEQAVGGDASGLRDAQQHERHAVDRAVAAAGRLLAGRGQQMTDTLSRRVASTLRAAIIDGSVADLLRGGVLDREVEAPGFGLDGTLTVPARQRENHPIDRQEDQGRRRARAHRTELEKDAERLRRRAVRLEAAADDAERRAVEARAEADSARKAAAEAADRLTGAD